MGLQRVKTLEVEQRIDEARGCGIAVVDCDQVGAERIAEIGFVAQRLVKGLADQVARQRRMIEPLGDPMDHRILEALVMQHGRIDEGSKLGLATDDVLRLAPDAVPDRIERGELRTLRIDLMHCHDCSRKFAWFGRYYSTAGGRLSRAGAGQSKPPPNALRGQFKVVRRFQEIKPANVRLLVNFGRPAIPGCWDPNGGKSHQHADIAGADRCGHAVGLDRRHRHPIDVAGPRPLEWLSPAPVGYRRLPGAVV